MLSRPIHLTFALLALAGCLDGEPDESVIRASLERLQDRWETAVRGAYRAEIPAERRGLPNVDLAFEARVHLRTIEVRKVGCRRADERMGHVCEVEIVAASGGGPAVARRIEARFVKGIDGWLATDLKPLGDAPPQRAEAR